MRQNVLQIAHQTEDGTEQQHHHKWRASVKQCTDSVLLVTFARYDFCVL